MTSFIKFSVVGALIIGCLFALGEMRVLLAGGVLLICAWLPLGVALGMWLAKENK